MKFKKTIYEHSVNVLNLPLPFDCMAKEIYQDNDPGALPDVLST